MNPFSAYWLAWIVLGFGIPEAWALTHDHRNTLSDQVWSLEGTGATFTRYFVAVFIIWLFAHMVFRAFR